VAKQCVHCGNILPSDNTRYCTKCGKKVPSSRPVKRSLSGDPPAWMQHLESSLKKPLTDIPPPELPEKAGEQEKTEDLSPLEKRGGFIEYEEEMVDDLPTRSLPVTDSHRNQAQPLTKSDHARETLNEEETANDLPTVPMLASLPETRPGRHNLPAPATGNGNVARLDEIEKTFTRPLAAQRQSISATPSGVQQHRQAPIEPVQSPVTQRTVTPAPFPQPQFPPVQVFQQTPPVSMPVPRIAHSKRRGRKRLMFVFVVLFVLSLAGVIAWIITFQPFAVPEITKTTQAFQNADLGITLQYPQQWAADVQAQKGAVYFHDVNSTDQVNITVVASGGLSMNQYISKVASSIGMTGQKAEASLSFAGALWQQTQGNVQQSGASYTASVLVATHGGRYYTIVQLAPSSTYIHEDQLVFSPIRSSFRFL
jgi:hypothetical protein